MDRITFFNSISGIDYPDMLVKFYDQFLALKELIFEPSSIVVLSSTQDESITFDIVFDNSKYRDQSLSMMYSSIINVYGRLISVNIDSLTDNEIIITMK